MRRFRVLGTLAVAAMAATAVIAVPAADEAAAFTGVVFIPEAEIGSQIDADFTETTPGTWVGAVDSSTASGRQVSQVTVNADGSYDVDVLGAVSALDDAVQVHTDGSVAYVDDDGDRHLFSAFDANGNRFFGPTAFGFDSNFNNNVSIGFLTDGRLFVVTVEDQTKTTELTVRIIDRAGNQVTSWTTEEGFGPFVRARTAPDGLIVSKTGRSYLYSPTGTLIQTLPGIGFNTLRSGSAPGGGLSNITDASFIAYDSAGTQVGSSARVSGYIHTDVSPTGGFAEATDPSSGIVRLNFYDAATDSVGSDTIDLGDVFYFNEGVSLTRPGRGVFTASRNAVDAAERGMVIAEVEAFVPPSPPTTTGYWMLAADGTVYAFGGVGTVIATGTRAPVTTLATKILEHPAGIGAWVLEENGTVHALGGAVDLGDIQGVLADGERATTMAATPTGQGYWIFTSIGRARAFGDAVDHGDLVALGVNPVGGIIDSTALPDGSGYYMAGADGGIFAFGAAEFHGSIPGVLAPGVTLNEPVVGMVTDPDNVGYWMVATDGGAFAFEADFVGSLPGLLAPGQRLNAPVNGMVPYGNGYLMVASDGGVFNFATDLEFLGSLGGQDIPSPIVGIAAFAVG